MPSASNLMADPCCCWPGTPVTASAIAGAAAVAGGSGDASGGRTDPHPMHLLWPDGLILLIQSDIDA